MHVFNVFVSSAIVFVCNVISYLEVSSRIDLKMSSIWKWILSPSPPQKGERKLGGKVSAKLFFSSRDGPEKVQKQGRDEITRKDYPTSGL